MREKSLVRVAHQYRALAEANVVHTVVGAIVLDEGQLGQIRRKGEIGWIVSFDLVNSMRLEVDMPESSLEELKPEAVSDEERLKRG